MMSNFMEWWLNFKRQEVLRAEVDKKKTLMGFNFRVTLTLAADDYNILNFLSP